MTSRTRHMAVGGALGALGLAIGYEIYRSRKAILKPVFSSSAHEEKEKHGHEEHERGEYGHKKHKHSEGHERGD